MFRGRQDAKLDEKGRFKVPSAFKQLVDEMSETQFYITSTNGKSAEVWPLKEWIKREAQLAQSSTMNPAIRKYQMLTSHYGQQVEIDNQARMLMPQLLRTSARLDGEVTAIGMGPYFEVHNRETYTAAVEQQVLTAEDELVLDQLFFSKKSPA